MLHAAGLKTCRLNRLLRRRIEPDRRRRFSEDPEAAFAAAGLTGEERDLVRRRDGEGVIRYGVIVFAPETRGAAAGVSNLLISAARRCAPNAP